MLFWQIKIKQHEWNQRITMNENKIIWNKLTNPFIVFTANTAMLNFASINEVIFVPKLEQEIDIKFVK